MVPLYLAVLFFAAASALPGDVVISKLGSDLRYQYFQDDNGDLRLTDSWLTRLDIEVPYWPMRDNEYHLFTRSNPTISQPLLMNNEDVFAATNFNPNHPTVYLIHGYGGSATSNTNLVLVPAYLAAADVNVIIVDWSRGANSSPVVTYLYSFISSINVARFAYWVSQVSGQDLSEVTMLGVGLSGLKVGRIGRLLEGFLGHIVSLDPNFSRLLEVLPPLRPDDAHTVEVIHTNVGNLGFILPMGKLDFYPNGGLNMPGCGRDDDCDRNRAVFYYAESLTSGGFTGIQCEDWEEALNEECQGPATVPMGGMTAKHGLSGIYSVQTNAGPPFSIN